MLKETNLDGVKSVARMLLMTPVHKTPYSPAVVQHPFTSCGIAVARKDGWVQTIDITANEMYTPDETDVYGSYLWAGYKALDLYYAAEYAKLGLTWTNLYYYGIYGFSQEYWQAAKDIAAYDLSVNGLTSATAFAMSYNSYALAGYIAGKMFTTGLERVEKANVNLTWLSYIEAMESSPIDIPMGGGVDYANGARLGITDLALNKYDIATDQLLAYSGITSLDAVMEAVPADKKR